MLQKDPYGQKLEHGFFIKGIKFCVKIRYHMSKSTQVGSGDDIFILNAVLCCFTKMVRGKDRLASRQENLAVI